jgi:hypothetical protein
MCKVMDRFIRAHLVTGHINEAKVHKVSELKPSPRSMKLTSLVAAVPQ